MPLRGPCVEGLTLSLGYHCGVLGPLGGVTLWNEVMDSLLSSELGSGTGQEIVALRGSLNN